MSVESVGKRFVVAAAVGSGVVLAVAGCSSSSSSGSSSSSSPSGSAASTSAPSGGVPSAPAGSTVVQGPQAVASGATYTQYKTSESPTAVTGYYETAMKNQNFSITNSGSGGGGWGQYGGSGAQVGGNNGSVFVEVNAGASKQSSTYFEVCSGPTAASVSNCQSGNHGQSQNS